MTEDTPDYPVSLQDRDLEEVYNRSPLQEVALEVRFPPLLEVAERAHEFQKNIRKDFPNARKGHHNETGQTFWEFETARGGTQLRLGAWLFAFISTEYTSYEDFKPKATSRISQLQAQFDVEPIRRIGLRYVNAMPLGSVDDSLENLTRFFYLDFDERMHPVKDLMNYRFEGRFRRGKNRITVRSGMVREQGPGDGLFYLLDMDAYRSEPTGIQSLEAVADALHEDIIREFHRHVTDEFLGELRKPPEEWD